MMAREMFLMLIFGGVACEASSFRVESFVTNHDDHESAKNNAILVMLAVILLLTLAFESMYEWVMEILEHKHLSHAKEILITVFKELTILGFISFLLFMFTRQGFVMKLNDSLFGRNEVEKIAIKELEEEGEPKEAAPTELKEIFEDVHIFIFVIMATFIGVVLGLFILALQTSAKWRKFEETSADELQELVDNGKVSKEHLQYWAIRYKFVNPQNVFTPAPPNANFGFSEYLSERLSEIIIELVEIPVLSWVCLFVFAIMMRPVMDFAPLLLIVFLVLAAVGLLSITSSMYHDIQNQMRKLQPTPEVVKRHLKDLVAPGYKGNVLPSPIDEIEMVTKNSKTCEIVQRVSAINRQEALFLFGAKGAKYQRQLMQLVLFLHTLALTCTLKVSGSAHFRHTVIDEYGIWAVLVPLAIVLASLIAVWPLLLPAYTIVTSVGFFADRKALLRSSEKVQRRSLARKIQVIKMLYHSADAHYTAKGKTQYDSEVSRAKKLYDGLPASSQKSLQDMFHAFSDLADMPRITRERIHSLVKVFEINERVHDCEMVIEDWIAKLDTDNSNDLTFSEFTTLMVHLLKDDIVEDPAERQARERQRLQELARSVDKDNDGFITQEELLQQLTKLKPPISEQEIRSLMAEIEGGRFGEMVRPENLTAWVVDVEEMSKLLRPVSAQGHH